MITTDLTEIRNKVLRLLTRREHSRHELYQKLRIKKFDSAAINQVLELAAAEGWQSDARFTEAFVTMRKRQGYGPLRIQAELHQRGIAADLIAQFINQEDEHWLQLLQTLHQKKYRSKIPTDINTRAKQMRFLQQRGFSPTQIHKFYGSLLKKARKEHSIEAAFGICHAKISINLMEIDQATEKKIQDDYTHST